MKMMYNGTQIKSLNIKHYEISTNDCDMIASDMQAGKTAVARGKKITGTGKSFEFASYGGFKTNSPIPVPAMVNVVEVACTGYPVQLSIELSLMKGINFAESQTVGNVVINGATLPLIARVENNILTITCSETIALEVFYGKDNYA